MEKDYLLFIDMIEKHPIIYDKKRKDFKNLTEKENAWMNISQVMGISVTDCKSKWHRLREKYTRELKNKVENRISGDQMPLESPLMQKMMFLKKHIRQRTQYKIHLQPGQQLTNTSQSIWQSFDTTAQNKDTQEDPLEEIDYTVIDVIRPSSASEDVPIEMLPRSPSPRHTSTPETCQDMSWDRSTEGFPVGFREPQPSTSSADRSATGTKRMREDEDQFTNDVNLALGMMTDFFKKRTAEDSDMAFGRFVALTLKELPKSKKSKLRHLVLKAIEDVEMD